MRVEKNPPLRVTEKRAREVIERLYPDAGNITIHQRLGQKGGWIDCPDTPLREVARLFEWKGEAVQIRLIDRNGVVRFPDYRLSEFIDPNVFSWEVRDTLQVNVNQGMREAMIVAVLGDEALLEYEMPAGTTALWIIGRHQYNPTRPVRNISYKNIPKKWQEAIEAAGIELDANPQ